MASNTQSEPAWSDQERMCLHIMLENYTFDARGGSAVLTEIFRGGSGRSARRSGGCITEQQWIVMKEAHSRALLGTRKDWKDIIQEPQTPAEKAVYEDLEGRIVAAATACQIDNFVDWGKPSYDDNSSVTSTAGPARIATPSPEATPAPARNAVLLGPAQRIEVGEAGQGQLLYRGLLVLPEGEYILRVLPQGEIQ